MPDRSYFPPSWLKGGVKPEDKAKQVIKNDRWDRQDLAAMIKSLAAFQAARRQLGDFTPTGTEAMNDMFLALLKADPELEDTSDVDPRFLVNRRVQEEAKELDEYDRLRRYSVGDDVQAALSSISMEPELETLFDRQKMQQQRADELQRALQALAQAHQDQIDLDELIAQWREDNLPPPEECPACAAGNQPGDGAEGDEEGEGGSGEGEGEGQGAGEPGGQGQGEGEGEGEGNGPAHTCGLGAQPGGGQGQAQPGPGGELTDEQKQQLEAFAQAQQDAADRIQEAQEAAEKAGSDFNEAMDSGRGQLREGLKKALGSAADEAQQMHDTAHAWGVEPGELHRLPADQRLALAKKLNDPRFKRIADLFGPMRNLMLSEQKRKTVMTPEEVYDVEIGNDIGRMLPQEALLLADEDTEMEFLRRFAEGKLMQYALRGVEKLNRGGIILCEDGSGSMSGERELWAKAVMLCLLHLARMQKREFHLIHFGSPGQMRHMPFVKPEDFTMERVIEAAELFFGGGTDFYTPMKKARDLLMDEFRRTGNVRADVVFVTDDECWVTDDWMEEYLASMHKMDATTWAIACAGSRRDGPIMRMSEGKVALIKDFLSGDEIRSVFRGL